MTSKLVNSGKASAQTRNPSPAGWPSYLSPTKASLARSDPHLRYSKAAVPKAENQSRRDGPLLLNLNRIEPSFQSRMQSPHEGTNNVLYGGYRNHHGANLADRNLTRTTELTSINQGLAGFGLQSAGTDDELPPGPRASPPEASEAVNQLSCAGGADLNVHNEDYFHKRNGFQAKHAPKTPSKSSRRSSEYAADGEPRLPSTPIQLGLEPSSKPPSGLLSSDSARKSKPKPRSVQSSPLKAQHAQLKVLHRYGIPATISLMGDKPNSRIRFVNVPSPDDILTVKLRLKYEKLGNELLEMTVCEIDSWAEAELGLHLRDLAAKQDLVRIRQMVNEYWALSKERAQCWTVCEQELRNSLPSQGFSPPNFRESPESLQELPSFGAVPLHSRQNLALSHDGTTLVIRWEILPCSNQKLERRFSASIIFDDGDVDGATESNEPNEVFGALIGSGKPVADAIKILAQTVFDTAIQKR